MDVNGAEKGSTRGGAGAERTGPSYEATMPGIQITHAREHTHTHTHTCLTSRPYVRLLHEESKAIAGVLSQLPAEVRAAGGEGVTATSQHVTIHAA
jgi:hypothetical protein